jgi:predicted nuclease of predicted toxin-antitoxin system
LNFLLDMNLPRELGRLLAGRGHGWRHVSDIGLYRAADWKILAEAKGHGEVILTHDLDYGNLLAFSGEPEPSVAIFRQSDILPAALFESMMRNWSECSPALEAGAIVVFEDTAIRIRRLPIGRRLS